MIPVYKDLIAMPKVNAPTLEEIFPQPHGQRTRRGRLFLKRLERATGITETSLAMSASRVGARTRLDFQNIWLLGVKGGKFVFMPLADVF